jgi:ArsR family transcriptional regulator
VQVEAEQEGIALLAKALGHPARIGIVRLLQLRGECHGGEIVDRIGLAQSTVAEHLRILRDAGIIVGKVQRPRTSYALDPLALLPLTGLLCEVTGVARREGPAVRTRRG